MAEFWGGSGAKKSCSWCDQVSDPANYPPGTTVYIAEAYNCENCAYWKAQPLPANENILTLYQNLPKSFEGWSGIRTISCSDIKFIFDLYDVPDSLRDEYYMKLLFFHEALIDRAGREKDKVTKK